MNKTILLSVTGAALIIGFSLIYAALIEQGIIFQPAGSRPKGQVIATPSEHVNLGVIYMESKMLDVSLVLKNPAESTTPTALLSLKGINPYDYELRIIEALKMSIADKNSGYKMQYNMKRLIDNATLAHEGVLMIRTYIRYNTEHHKEYNLDIISRTYTLLPGEPVKVFILKKTKRIVEKSQKKYNKNMLLAADNSD
jgi:hypothetical protein